MRKRGEKATGGEKPRVQASEQSIEENQSSVSDERSQCWGKAATPNEVIFLSSPSTSPSSIVKFDLKEI
jgi:hypothetical protein